MKTNKPVMLTIHTFDKKSALKEEVHIKPNWYMDKDSPEMHHMGSGIFDAGDDKHFFVYHSNQRFKFSNIEAANIFTNLKQKQFQKGVVEAHEALSKEYEYSDKDKETLGQYTSNLNGLNHVMTDKKPLTKDESTMVDKLSKILNKHKTKNPMVVYSGISKNHHKVLMDSDGSPIHHHAFISTSINPNIARGFAEKSGGHIVELHIPEGIPSAYVSHISEHDGERELILPRGTNIKIDHSQRKVMVHDSGNFIVHHGTVVKDD